jgi:hypothetical protein
MIQQKKLNDIIKNDDVIKLVKKTSKTFVFRFVIALLATFNSQK